MRSAWLLPPLTLLATAWSSSSSSSSSSFDPYLLDGGLVTAVAGRDYALIASDTRLTDGGYGIRSRDHLGGRIWSAVSSSGCIVDGYDDDDDNERAIARRRDFVPPPVLVGSAGCSADCESLRRRVRLELDALLSSSSTSSSSSSYYYNRHPGGGGGGVRSVANLLQQVLYGRRSFPYYSFCVVAGLDRARRGLGRGRGRGGGGGEEGAAYVYDAIGSYERVAVACAGTGRELLQPILDRSFSPPSRPFRGGRSPPNSPRRRDGTKTTTQEEEEAAEAAAATGDDFDEVDDVGGGGGRVSARATTTTTADVPASRQRAGVAGGLVSPVRTTVDCPWEDAVNVIARAYASVAEREISVGDEVVICVILTNDAARSKGRVSVGGGDGDEDEDEDDDDDDDFGGAVPKLTFARPTIADPDPPPLPNVRPYCNKSHDA
ncbi:hypothetical protein ACHAW5_000726 [Stephanodiscus triporus]|uniref:Proteasome endopeptidase complex n=1 Tax=Stephanodiscus triporus TaxID=2934178 RepID=A0ABD3N166_9STRA